MSPSEPCTNETVADGQTCHTLTFLQASAGGKVKNLKANPWQQKTGLSPPPPFFVSSLPTLKAQKKQFVVLAPFRQLKFGLCI